MRQVLHREPVSIEGFPLVVGFLCTSVKKFDCGFLPLKDTSSESQNIWLVSGSSSKDNDLIIISQ